MTDTHHLDPILNFQGTCAVSIYLPLQIETLAQDHNRIALKNACAKAMHLLKEAPQEEREAISMRLEQLQGDDPIWRDHCDGLAIFVTPDFSSTLRLQGDVPEFVTVSNHFHTLPLLRLQHRPDGFWLLGLDEKDTWLWRVQGGKATPVPMGTVEGIVLEASASMGEVLNLEHPNHSNLNMHTTSRASTGGGAQGTFHGHGAGKDVNQQHLRRFFQIITQGVQQAIGQSNDPIVPVGVERHHATLRSIDHGLEHLTPEGIHGSPSGHEPRALLEKARALLTSLRPKPDQEAWKQWQDGIRSGKATTDLRYIASLAIQGRIRTLMVKDDAHLWGQLDAQSGDVKVESRGDEDPGLETHDLLNDIAQMVVRRGGEVIHCGGERVPLQDGVAAISY